MGPATVYFLVDVRGDVGSVRGHELYSGSWPYTRVLEIWLEIVLEIWQDTGLGLHIPVDGSIWLGSARSPVIQCGGTDKFFSDY